MSKDKTFRPPMVVRETAQAAFDLDRDHLSVGVNLAKAEPVSLTEVRRMYHFLSGNREKYRPDLTKSEGEPTDGTAEWSMWGGYPGLRWSRRILCQQKMLKVSSEGDVSLPGLIDLQLGPDIFAAIIKQDCGKVSSALAEAGITSSCLPVDSGTLALFSGDNLFAYVEDEIGKIYVEGNETVYKLTPGVLPVDGVLAKDLVIVDDNKSRLAGFAKSAGDHTSGFSCFHITDSEKIANLSIEKLCLLKANDEIEHIANFIKVDDSLGLVLGWAIICKIGGTPYFDTQGDYIPEQAMLEAATDFMADSRVAGEMHTGEKVGDEEVVVSKGTVVFAWPMTEEIAKAFGVEVEQTGLMIAMKPDDPAMLEKFRDGTYKGFSIGGDRIREFTEEVV